MERVLHIIAGLGSGGAESIVMNYYRFINRERIQFDFLVRNSAQHRFDDEITKYGGKIYYTAPFPKRTLRNIYEVYKFFKKHKEYNIIHVHANSLMYIVPLIIAKKNGVKCRIIHCHSTHSQKKIFNIIHYFNRMLIGKYANIFIACSKDAGKWMFRDNEYIILNNGIDISKFKYDIQIRNEIRKEFKIEDKFVIGHVGRFSYEKNHGFVLDIFEEILKKQSNAVLMLVGEGELFDKIKRKSIEMNIGDKVIFTGVRSDVNKLMLAMDVFLFPSIYEGLPLTLIEAQASGLPCVVSNVITKEVNVTNNINYLDLNQDIKEWANCVLSLFNFKRIDTGNMIKDAGYDISLEAKKLEKLYLGGIE